jgi:hypothetical protein
MVEGMNGAKKARHTKTLAWRDADEAVLKALRAQVAATFGQVWSERDVVAASLRAALSNPAVLGPANPAA